MEIILALHMLVKVNAVHTSDCPPISLCCKPSHWPARGLASSRTFPKAKSLSQSLCLWLLAQDAISGQC